MSEKKATLQLLQSTSGICALNLSEFLQADILGWPIEEAFNEVVKTLPPGGELLIDEVVLPKPNTSKMDTIWVFSSTHKRPLQGQAYVVLAWVKDQMTRVVGFEKLASGSLFEMTERLLKRFQQYGPAIQGLRADGMYFKPECWKRLKSLGIHLISKPRRDSYWWYGNQQLQLKKWASNLPIESFHYYPKLKGYARSFELCAYDKPKCRVAIFRPKRSCPEDSIQFMASTDLSLTTQQIIRAHRKRWKIEVLFRDCKQNLGLGQHQGYLQSSLRHISMVFLTFNFLDSLRQNSQSIGSLKRSLIHASNLQRTRDLELLLLTNPFDA